MGYGHVTRDESSLDRRIDRLLRGITEGFVLLFAAWTVCAHAVVQSGGSFALLRTLAPLALVAGAIVFGVTRRRPPLIAAHSGDETEPAGGALEPRVPVMLAAAAVVGLAWALAPPVAAWAMSVVVLAATYAHGIGSGEVVPEPPASGRGDLVLLSLALAVAVSATLFYHRPDPDDCLYLNMAVSVLDAPDAPIFASDILHRIPGEVFEPTYRFHAIELFFALLAGLLGTTPIVVAHLLLPPLFAVLTVCAVARLARFLTGRWWGITTAATVTVLLVARGSHWQYGNFAFVRMFQGKAVFVSALVPIIVILALELWARPGWRRWLLLACAQVAAIGLTANAIYAAPLVAGLTLVAAARPRLTELRRLVVAASALVYPVAAGLLLLHQLTASGVQIARRDAIVSLPATLAAVFGGRAGIVVWLAALIAAPAAFTGARRRWAAAFTGAFALFFLCPFLDAFWERNLTGPVLLWRLFWVVPLPFFVAALLLVPLRLAAARSRALLRGALVIGGLVAAAILAIRMAASSGRSLGWPSLKVPHPAYDVAQLVVATLPASATVLACDDVAAWIPTFRRHPSPIATRVAYLAPGVRLFPAWAVAARLEERMRLLAYASGRGDREHDGELLAEWLEHDAIDAVVLPAAIPATDRVHAILRGHGYAPSPVDGYLIYRRGAR